MIADAESLENGALLSADICIVGGGAAGIAMALSLSDRGRDVLLLEGGGSKHEAPSQALYAGEVADAALHAPLDTYRRRAWGGSTALWGGRCAPFDPIDFEPRNWIPGPGWPFGLETLRPWYQAANRLCEAGRFAYSVADACPAGVPPMLAGFVSDDFTNTTLERFSCPTDLARRYGARLARCRTTRVLLHANVTELHTSEDGGAVDWLDVATLGGRRFTVRARHVVLAAGGLEVPRLLLASRDRHPDGIGNGHGQVGRNYMCHIAGTAGRLAVRGGAAAAWHGYDISDDGVYCRRRLALTGAAQRRLRVGNFVARLHHPRIPDPSHRTGALSALYFAKPFVRFEYAKRLHGSARLQTMDLLRHAANLARDPHGAAGFLLHWARARTLAIRKYPSVIVAPRNGVFSLDYHAEQVPNPDSRVTLGAQRDALGMQQLRVDWRYSALDIETVRAAFATLARDMASSGAASLSFDAAEIEVSALRDGAYGGHHIGTARMADDPRLGVVDRDCRVHGIRNLYIAGSAVFPTSGQANPTLTIVALALRLVENGKAVA